MAFFKKKRPKWSLLLGGEEEEFGCVGWAVGVGVLPLPAVSAEPVCLGRVPVHLTTPGRGTHQHLPPCDINLIPGVF